MKFYFGGHTSFGNRGCEALVRSTIGLLRERLPDATFVVPSAKPPLDRTSWPQAETLGVEFLLAPEFPAAIKWWNRAARVLPPLSSWIVPHYQLDERVAGRLHACDAFIMSGGDVLSLEYGLASLYDWTGLAENAMAAGIPAVLWAGSVGPFTRNPRVERFMSRHLRRYRAISVREDETRDYLAGLDLVAEKVADPAFTLVPEPVEHAPFMPAGTEGVVGLNFSPLIREFRGDERAKQELDHEVVRFVEHLLEKTDFGILLIPHVAPLDGRRENNDHHYMTSLIQKAGISSSRLSLLPATYNAAQLKYIIRQCRYFIGARTHATIAAFSSLVPTVSIAYSVKATGINRDLFGGLDYVLRTPDVTAESLGEYLNRVRYAEGAIRTQLEIAIPKVQTMSRHAAHHALAQIAKVEKDGPPDSKLVATGIITERRET